MLLPVIEEHIKILKQKFCDYFDRDIGHLDWVLNSLAIIKVEELTDLKADRTSKLKFCQTFFDNSEGRISHSY